MKKKLLIVLTLLSFLIPFQLVQSSDHPKKITEDKVETILFNCAGVTATPVSGGIEIAITGNNVNYVKIQKYGPYEEWWVCAPPSWNKPGSQGACNTTGGTPFFQPLAVGTYDVEVQYTNLPNCPIQGIQVTGGSTCGAPTGISENNRTQNSVGLTWSNEGANSYTLTYNGQTQTAASNSTTLTNGVPQGSFVVTITSNCPSGNTPSGTYTVSAFNNPPNCSGYDSDAGKDGNPSFNRAAVEQQYASQASNYTFGEMIGFNGGKEWEHYDPNKCIQQNYPNADDTNPFIEISNKVRFFHDMGDDFCLDQFCGTKQLPNQVTPNGTPTQSFITKTKSLLVDLKSQGFDIQVTLESIFPLNGVSRSFPEKWYNENEWAGTSNPADIRQTMKNYMVAFINEMAPPCCSGNDCIVESIEIGNETWGYPDPLVYDALLRGAVDAFEQVYDNNSDPNCRDRKMKLLPSSFQSFRDSKETPGSNCSAPNTGSFACIFDDMGEFIPCDLLDEIDALNIHPYSFKKNPLDQQSPATLNLPPEDDNSVFQTIVNTVAWRDANAPNMPIHVTEYGYDTDFNLTNVNEFGQAAYLIRSLLIQGRYGVERSYVYSAFDLDVPGTQVAYLISGLHTLGTVPDGGSCDFNNNPGQGSPYPPLGQKKAGFYAHKDFVDELGNTKYQNVAQEGDDLHAYIVEDENTNDKYLVFWNTGAVVYSAGASDIFTPANIPSAQRTFNLPTGFKLESNTAQIVNYTDPTVGSTNPSPFSVNSSSPACASATITQATKMPAYIKLIPCGTVCNNVSTAGSLNTPSPSSGTSPFDPQIITSNQPASGGSGGSIQYRWQLSTNGGGTWNTISGATSLSYDPPSVTQNTLFRRGAKRSACTAYENTAPVSITITNTNCTTYTSTCNNNLGGLIVEVCGGDIVVEVLTNEVKYVKLQSFVNGYSEEFICSDYINNEDNCTPQVFPALPKPNGSYQIEYNFVSNSGATSNCVIPNIVVSGSNNLVSNGTQFITIQKQREVDMSWITTTDFKNDKFIIQRSADGIHFTDLLEMDSKSQSTTPISYSSIDPYPMFGLNYYRLKQIYEDGSFEYSMIQKIDFNIDVDEISVFPNPADQEVFVNLRKLIGRDGRVRIINGFGVVTHVLDLKTAADELAKFDLSKYADGIYYISIDVEGRRSITKRFIKSKL